MSMDQISQLVSESMKDVDNVSDEDLEDDEDLMVILYINNVIPLTIFFCIQNLSS